MTLLAAVALIFGGCSSTDRADSGALIGGQLPSPAGILTLAGDPLTSFSDPDRVVVLNIWATWCAPCRRELPSLEKLSDALDGTRFAVVGLSIDEDSRQVREYLASKEISYPNYIDHGGRWVQQLEWIPAYPATLVLGRGGDILAVIKGERTWHTAQTVAALEKAWVDGHAILLE